MFPLAVNRSQPTSTWVLFRTLAPGSGILTLQTLGDSNGGSSESLWQPPGRPDWISASWLVLTHFWILYWFGEWMNGWLDDSVLSFLSLSLALFLFLSATLSLDLSNKMIKKGYLAFLICLLHTFYVETIVTRKEEFKDQCTTCLCVIHGKISARNFAKTHCLHYVPIIIFWHNPEMSFFYLWKQGRIK